MQASSPTVAEGSHPARLAAQLLCIFLPQPVSVTHSSCPLDSPLMRIAKPMLLVATPLGVGFGIYEGYRLAGGLVFLMVALVTFISVCMATVVATVRKERREEEAARARVLAVAATEPGPAPGPAPGESK